MVAIGWAKNVSFLDEYNMKISIALAIPLSFFLFVVSSAAVDFHNIHGYIRDENGDAVADAQVIIKNERTGDTLKQFTDEKGFYNMELANMEHGWKDGDTLLINVSGTGYYANYEGGKEVKINASVVLQRVDITIYKILKADFITPDVIYAGNATAFKDNSSSKYGIINYTWQFGDGSIGYGKNVSHVYSKAGNYDVTLTITDKKEHEDSVTKKVYVSSIEKENKTPAFEFLTLILIMFAAFILRKGK